MLAAPVLLAPPGLPVLRAGWALGDGRRPRLSRLARRNSTVRSATTAVAASEVSAPLPDRRRSTWAVVSLVQISVPLEWGSTRIAALARTAVREETGVGVGVAVSGGSSNVAPSPPPLPAGFAPSGVQSMYVSLLMAMPEPGNTLGAGAVITLTVRVDNMGPTPYEGSPEIKIISNGYTGSGQACLVAERGPVSFTPRSRGEYVMSLSSICPPPYQTVRLQLSLFDAATNQFLFQTNYTGGYRIVP
jgi:hypothetical protein